MNKIVWIVVILVVIIGGIWYLSGDSSEPVVLPVEGGPDAEDINIEPAGSATTTDTSIDAAEGADTVKEFTVTGTNFAFTPSTMTVNKGDTVKITLNNVDGFHDFVIDELGAKTKQIKSGESDIVTFVADKAGTFEYYCSVGQHRAMGMKGTLVVK